MDLYKPRKSTFVALHEIHHWQIKVYTITVNNQFSSKKTLNLALQKIPEWLGNSQNYPIPHFKIACFIMHEGEDAIYSVLNWWNIENMLHNHVWLTPKNKPSQFELFSEGGISFCVWELKIIWHERNAWIKHVLKNPSDPQFDKYLIDTL